MESFRSSVRIVVLGILVFVLAVPTIASTKQTHKRNNSKSHSAKTMKAAQTTTSRRSTARTSARVRSSKSGVRGKAKSARSTSARSRRSRGQQAIDSDRIREIQQALITAKYMEGEPSGVWDEPTRSAMARFQSDNGWQSRVVPDSRALIKLGLGPNHDNLLNPETSAVRLPATVTSQTDSELEPGGGLAHQK